MRIFFTSDLHLSDASPEKNSNFIQFLQKELVPGDCLILGGDIFDLFIGRGAFFQKKYSLIIRVLKDAMARGVSIRYVEGNHDFLLGKLFLGSLGDWEVWPERGWVNHPQGKVYVEHGDLIDSEDYGYRLLRFFTRSLMGKILIKALPDWVLANIGEWSSKQSRKYNNLDRVPTAKREHTQKLFTKYAKAKLSAGARYVFMGHSHLPQYEVFLDGSGWYVNVGFHEKKIPYALIQSEGEAPKLLAFG
jgi:UDP-2,3-diacylglucosamine hydrolase